MRDLLEERYNSNVDLVKSGGGVFEIIIDEKLAFSKKKEGRFPIDEERINLTFE